MSKKGENIYKRKDERGKEDIFGAIMKTEKQNTDIFMVKRIMKQNRS